MGKWDRRRIPRRNFNSRNYRDYDYVEPPPSPPSPHHSQSNPPAIEDDNGSSWEIEFCKSVGVRWKRVVNVKKFMHCHDNIIKWDDSAAKEAFHSAKQRYWEKINRLPIETPLEDPDKYTDEIDWNPHIDPELMSELDTAYFNPDEVESRGKFFRKERNQVLECDSVQNTWESSNPTLDFGGHLNDASTTWGQNTKSKNSKDDENPWEQTPITVNEASKNDTWKGCTNESWDWKPKQINHRQTSDINNNSSNYRKSGWQNVGHGGEKARTYTDYRSNNWKKPNNDTHLQQHSVYSGNNRQRSSASRTGGPWERDRRECVFEPQDYNNRDFQDSCYGGGNAFQSSCRKREGSFQYPPRYKSSRFQGRGN